MLNLETMDIVSVLKWRGKSALKPFLAKLKQARAMINAVATDMSGGDIAAVMTSPAKGGAGVRSRNNMITTCDEADESETERPAARDVSRANQQEALQSLKGHALAPADEPGEPQVE